MAHLYRPAPVGPLDRVRVWTDSGGTVAAVLTTESGQAIRNDDPVSGQPVDGLLVANGQGNLPLFRCANSPVYVGPAGSPTQLTALPVGEDTPSALSDFARATVTVTQQAADYTLVLADANTEVEGTKATAQTVTVPPHSAVAFPVGTTINVRQYGAGQITVAGGAGVTLRAPNGAKAAKQYSTVGLIQRATDEWIVSGDTTP